MRLPLLAFLACLSIVLPASVHAGGLGYALGTFLANEGQWLPTILFKGRSATANVSFLHNGISFSMVEPEDEEHEDDGVDHHASPNFQVWNMYFAGIDAGMRIGGEQGRKSVTNFLSGSDRSRWVVNPMEYERIVYRGLYPGIDLHFHAAGLDLEYDHVLQPGADIGLIRTVYAGIEGLALNASGDLVISTVLGTQVQRAPVSWQLIDGVKRAVQVGFVLHNDSTFGFAIHGKCDRAHELVIDPLFEMVWASYTRVLGGSDNMNYAFATAMDAEGNVYMTGFVDGTFPVTPGAYSGPGNVYGEVFVAKFSSDGTTLLYSTYLPGESAEVGASIAVDALGRAYVTGSVALNFTGVTNFPSTPNAYQPVHDTGTDAFLTVLDPTGSSLVYSTFIGGSGSENGHCVALGPTGIAYVTGTTSIGDLQEVAATNYPSGDGELFAAKFDITQSGAASLIYLVRIGAGNFSSCSSHGIAVDDAGNAYVTGSVYLSFGTSIFPVTPGAFDTTFGSGDEGAIGYLIKLGNTLPVSLVYATYLGPGEATSVATFGGDAFVIGTTFNASFPTTAGALQPAYGGGNTDAFALRMNAIGTALIYSTFLGGDAQDQGTDIVVNGAGEAIAAGISRGGFPTSAGGYQPVHAGLFTNDIFLVQLNSSGIDYGCGGSTYVGGTQDEYYGSSSDHYAPSIALLNVGGLDIVSVVATSHSQDFPTTPGVYEENKVNGISDQPVFFKMTCVGTALAPQAGFNSNAALTCTGGLVDFDDTSLFGATSWNWSFPGGIPATSTVADPQDIAYASPGTYDVTLVACNAVGCDTITQQITLVAQPLPTVSLGNDTAFCTGGSVIIAAAEGFFSYTWQLDGALLPDITSSIVATEAGMYTVLVEDGGGCAAADSLEVLALSTPVAAFTLEVRSIPCGPEEVLFQAAAGASNYVWDFGDSTTAIGPEQAHNYIVNGTYAVSLTVSNGPCSASIVVPVLVDGGNASVGPIVIPNIFSPNGDGVNDCFAPSGLADFPECFDLVVYDRWGIEMFRSSATNAAWDGKAGNGELAPGGVYYYLLTFDSNEHAGNLQLLR